MEYRIKSEQYIDPWGKESPPRYFIEYRAKFLFFWKIWRKVRHTDCSWGDCHQVVTYFQAHYEAETFARVHLCGGKKRDGHEIKIVTQGDCRLN